MLASQPKTPPTISQIIKFILFSPLSVFVTHGSVKMDWFNLED
jgi:hypothetical protein